MKYWILLALIFQPAYADDLKFTHLKIGEMATEALQCSDEASWKKLDDSQKAGLKNSFDLLQCQKDLANSKIKIQSLKPIPEIKEKENFYHSNWFRSTVFGTILLSTGIIIGVVASE